MANKTQITLCANNHASGATGVETIITLRKSSGTDATSTGTTFVVTSGKTFVITGIIFGVKGHNTATNSQTTFNVRINTNGNVVAATTPILLSARVCTTAVANTYDKIDIPLPSEGYEIYGTGTLQIGVSAASAFTTNAPTWDVLITGYEY